MNGLFINATPPKGLADAGAQYLRSIMAEGERCHIASLMTGCSPGLLAIRLRNDLGDDEELTAALVDLGDWIGGGYRRSDQDRMKIDADLLFDRLGILLNRAELHRREKQRP